jgi:hypothetical protein
MVRRIYAASPNDVAVGITESVLGPRLPTKRSSRRYTTPGLRAYLSISVVTFCYSKKRAFSVQRFATNQSFIRFLLLFAGINYGDRL